MKDEVSPQNLTQLPLMRVIRLAKINQQVIICNPDGHETPLACFSGSHSLQSLRSEIPHIGIGILFLSLEHGYDLLVYHLLALWSGAESGC